MTAVLVFGDVPGTGHVSGPGAERVVVGDAEGHVPPDVVIDLIRDRMDARGHVLALYPEWHAEPALRALRLAHSGLSTDRLALVPSPLPPLALSLVADQLDYLSPYYPPGALVALVSALTRVTLSGAWVRSVTGLEHIPASLSNHMASYVPGGGFMVTASPGARIHRITSSDPLGEMPFHPPDPVHVLTADGEGDTDWAQDHLLPALRAQYVRPLPHQPLAEEFWGTKKHLEFVAFSGHPKALAVIAASVRCRPCPWCGNEVGTSTCPFCGNVAPYRPAPETPAQPSPHDAPPEGETAADPEEPTPQHAPHGPPQGVPEAAPAQAPPRQQPPAPPPPQQPPGEQRFPAPPPQQPPGGEPPPAPRPEARRPEARRPPPRHAASAPRRPVREAEDDPPDEPPFPPAGHAVPSEPFQAPRTPNGAL